MRAVRGREFTGDTVVKAVLHELICLECLVIIQPQCLDVESMLLAVVYKCLKSLFSISLCEQERGEHIVAVVVNKSNCILVIVQGSKLRSQDVHPNKVERCGRLGV